MMKIFVQLQKPQEDHHNHGGRPYPIHTKYEVNGRWGYTSHAVRVTEFRSQEAFENQVDGYEHFMSVQEARELWGSLSRAGAERSERIEKEYYYTMEIPYDSTK